VSVVDLGADHGPASDRAVRTDRCGLLRALELAARRALDVRLISREAFFEFYKVYDADDRRGKEARKGGGNFWNTQNVRLGKRFGGAVVRAAKEGRLLYQDAYRLTDLHGKTFDQFAKNLGF